MGHNVALCFEILVTITLLSTKICNSPFACDPPIVITGVGDTTIVVADHDGKVGDSLFIWIINDFSNPKIVYNSIWNKTTGGYTVNFVDGVVANLTVNNATFRHGGIYEVEVINNTVKSVSYTFVSVVDGPVCVNSTVTNNISCTVQYAGPLTPHLRWTDPRLNETVCRIKNETIKGSHFIMTSTCDLQQKLTIDDSNVVTCFVYFDARSAMEIPQKYKEAHNGHSIPEFNSSCSLTYDQYHYSGNSAPNQLTPSVNDPSTSAVDTSPPDVSTPFLQSSTTSSSTKTAHCPDIDVNGIFEKLASIQLIQFCICFAVVVLAIFLILVFIVTYKISQKLDDNRHRCKSAEHERFLPPNNEQASDDSNGTGSSPNPTLTRKQKRRKTKIRSHPTSS